MLPFQTWCLDSEIIKNWGVEGMVHCNNFNKTFFLHAGSGSLKTDEWCN